MMKEGMMKSHSKRSPEQIEALKKPDCQVMFYALFKFDLKEIEQKMSLKGSSLEDVVKGPNRGYWKPILVNWLMAGIPSLTAILLANHFLAYIETAAGFLAPVFLILFPCLITI